MAAHGLPRPLGAAPARKPARPRGSAGAARRAGAACARGSSRGTAASRHLSVGVLLLLELAAAQRQVRDAFNCPVAGSSICISAAAAAPGDTCANLGGEDLTAAECEGAQTVFGWGAPDTPFQLLATERICSSEAVRDLGALGSAQLCYEATIADAACGPAFMFPTRRKSLSCRCCKDASPTGSVSDWPASSGMSDWMASKYDLFEVFEAPAHQAATTHNFMPAGCVANAGETWKDGGYYRWTYANFAATDTSKYNDAKAAADPRHLLCKKMTFDPASPLTSYKEVRTCGARGNDARVDKTVCPGEAASVISTMATDGNGKAIRETIDGCEYFEYEIYACDEPNPHADSCFAVITDADAPDNAGRANDLTTSTDCVDQGHLGAVLTKDECANAYYYLDQNPQEDAIPRNWRCQENKDCLINNNKKWPYGCWWQASNRDVWFWETPPDGTQNMEKWPRQICRTACPGDADSAPTPWSLPTTLPARPASSATSRTASGGAITMACRMGTATRRSPCVRRRACK